MEKEDPIISLVNAGYYPDVLKINEGFGISFNKAISRVYLRKGNEAIIVPQGYEWFAINYYNLRTMAQRIPFTVFLSYAREDLWLAYKIQKIFSEAGVFVYIAELFPEPGVTLWEKIKRMIETSDVVIVLWTRNAKSSAFVNQEIGYAEKCGKTIVPLVEEGVNVEASLAGKEYIRYERERDADAFSSLCHAIVGFIVKKLGKLEEQKKQQAVTILGGTFLILGIIALFAALGGKK